MTEERAIRVGTTCAAAKDSVAAVDDAGVGEVSVIQDVEELRAQFEFHPLRNHGCLGKGQVEIDIAWSAEEVARQGSIGGEGRICNHLRIGGKHSRPGHAGRIAALRVAEAIRIEIIVAGITVNRLGGSGVERVQWTDDVGVNIEWVSGTGWTLGVIGVLLPEVSEHVKG